jgi:hypothetical protein
MPSIRMLKLTAAALTICGLTVGVEAQESRDPSPTGFLRPQRDDAWIERFKARAAVVHREVVPPLFRAEDVSHVASGVALRDRARGTIHLRGVPAKSQVVRSFLLWNLSDQKREGAASAPILFEGNLVTGKKTADNTDPCWSHEGNHSYLADVTRFTNQAGGPNQEYEVGLPFFENTGTEGQNPWASNQSQHEVLLEGASLIVIYRNEQTRGMLYVFAPSGDNMFVGSTSYALATPGFGEGLFTMVGADGQRGGGHDNTASNELTFFDLAQIAGPPVAASDWDGSDGLTLPQLWDTHTHRVKLSETPSKVEYKGSGDCLVPVGFVLDLE